MRTRTSKRAKACDISEKTKLEVWERDGGRCVVCGNTHNVMPNAHIVPRSAGGLGVATNVVTLCTNFTENKCHYKYDFGTGTERDRIDEKIIQHMKQCYGESWSKDDQYYRKYDFERSDAAPTKESEDGQTEENWFDGW